jgi:hypothetical protein
MKMDMKDSVIKLSVSIVLVLLVSSLALAEEAFRPVEPEKIPGILMTISNQTKANFEKIHTWQGELETSSYFIDKGKQAKETFETMTDAAGPCPNEVVELTGSKIIFKCDLDKGLSHSKRSREKPTRYFDPADNRDLGTKSTTTCSSHIMTNEYQISSNPNAWMNGKIIERKAIKEKSDKDCSSGQGLQPAYLPRYLFDIDSQVWHIYPHIAETMEEKGEYLVDGLAPKVEQRTVSGDVQYRVYNPYRINSFGIDNFWKIHTFSANSGYNIISLKMITAKDGKLMQQENIEYQKINGVYVPVRRTEDSYDFRDFNLRSHTETAFKNVRINEDIPAETFTYKNLGLKDGDKFIDKILDKEYTYQDQNLIEVTKKSD